MNNYSTADKLMMVFATIFILLCSTWSVAYCHTKAEYEHLAVIHHAAFYEADSYGKVSFHWNDDSFAQTPFR